MGLATEHIQNIPTVFVVDADVSVYDSLQALARLEAWQTRCFESVRRFLASPRLTTPACLVLDFSLLQIDGLDLHELIADRPEIPVILVTDRRDVSVAVRAIRAGAVEFLTKPFDPQHMLAGIGEGIARSRYALERDAELHVLTNRFSLLSRREREVLTFVVEGHLNKQIAFAMGITEFTVKTHRGQVMRKMEARSLADLIKMTAKLHLDSVRSSAMHDSWREAFATQRLLPRERLSLASN